MKKKNRPPVPQGSGPNHKPNHTPPVVSGQRAKVLNLIRERLRLSLELTADYAIPEAAARKHELLAMGFNIVTEIKPKIIFRGEARYNVALYSLENPEWSALAFLMGGNDGAQ